MLHGFDNDKYVKIQSEKIKERIKKFGGKLYLEIGGKLFDDTHAMRVLPGFKIDSKIKMLEELKDDLEIIYVINANDIQNNRIRSDYGISYDSYLLKSIDEFQSLGFKINSVVITLYNNQNGIDKFRKNLENHKIKTYLHTYTKGYPSDIDTIVSEEGYGANPYIRTTRSLVVVTAPGANSGKLATCLSQLYHEFKRGKKAGYAKFETFPVWNLPLKHPINVAYEAATADIKDINMIDSFHLQKYNISAINYNRDLEVFPILKNILNKITKKDIYCSPTDMGVNMIGFCIKNNKLVERASKMEIIRRYYRALNDYKLGIGNIETCDRIKILMNEMHLDTSFREVIKPCLDKSIKVQKHMLSLALPNSKIITGKETDVLSAPCSMILNAIKELTKIPDEVDLISPTILSSILKYKTNSFAQNSHILNLQDVFTSLSICSATNPIIEKSLNNMFKLEGCEAHASYIVTNGDLKILRDLKINLTCEPVYYSDKLFDGK